MLTWTEKTVAVSELKPYERNPRKISKEAFGRLKASIQEMGYHQRCVAQPDGRLIGGHQRLKVFKELGIEQIQILIPSRELTEAEYRRMLIQDNLPFGEFDVGMLAADFTLPELEAWGMPSDWLPTQAAVEGLTDPDATPTAPTHPITLYGDVWCLGDHRILCGDSTKAEDVAKLMDGAKCELLFTSPPYSDQRTYGGGMDLSPEYLSQFIDCAEKYCEYMVVNLGLKREKHEIVPYWDIYINKAKSVGYHFLQWGVWARPSAGSVGNQSAFLPTTHEWMLVFGTKFKDINRCEERLTKKDEKRNSRTQREPDGTMKRTKIGRQEEFKELESVVILPQEMSNKERRHPAQFPVALPEKYINAITNTGQSVYEPFSGSGTTIIAGEMTGRKVLAIELSPAYVDLAVIRWQNFTGKEAIHAETGETFNSMAQRRGADIPLPSPQKAAAAGLGADTGAERDASRSSRKAAAGD